MSPFALLIFALAGFVGAASTPASAQNRLDYFSISGGVLSPHEAEGRSGGTDYTLGYETGYAMNFALGLDWGNGLRSEVELGYGTAPVDSLDFNGGSVGQSADDLNFYTLTINGFYDFAVGLPVIPYAGGGIGLARSETVRAAGRVGGVSITAPGKADTSLATMGEIGLAFPMSNTARLTAGYRYIYLFDGESSQDDTTASYFKAGLRLAF